MLKDDLKRFATIGKRLAYLRDLNGWSQDEVALRIGKTQPNILAYEKDRYKNIPDVTLQKLADIYGVALEDIKGEDDQMPLWFLPQEVRKFLMDPENRSEIIQMYKEYQLKKLEGLK